MESSPSRPKPPPGNDEASANESSLPKVFGLLLGPLLAAFVGLRGDGSPKSHLEGLFVLGGVFWILEVVPPAVTALLVVALAPLMGVVSSKEAFAAFGNPILYMFVGSFFLAEAMNIHGLGDRLAITLARGGRGRVSSMAACAMAAFVLSMWTSNAAATAVVLPMAQSTARRVPDPRYGAAMVLAIAWGASMGGLGTPVGTPPNLIGLRALRDAGYNIDFFTWMQIGVPMGLAMMAAMALLWRILFRITPGPLDNTESLDHRPWSRGEVAALTAFLLAISGWILPGLLELMKMPGAAWCKSHLPEEVVALLAASVLFFWPVAEPGQSARMALAWEDAVRIDWGTVLLFGGGVLLGDLASKTGAADDWGHWLLAHTGAHDLWSLVALVTAVSLLLSEVASNTASAALMLPLAFGLAKSAGVAPVPVALGAIFGSSFGFMMPISTAPNAMAYGTGAVTMGQMVKAGICFDLLGFVVVLAVLRTLCPLLGIG